MTPLSNFTNAPSIRGDKYIQIFQSTSTNVDERATARFLIARAAACRKHISSSFRVPRAYALLSKMENLTKTVKRDRAKKRFPGSTQRTVYAYTVSVYFQRGIGQFKQLHVSLEPELFPAMSECREIPALDILTDGFNSYTKVSPSKQDLGFTAKCCKLEVLKCLELSHRVASWRRIHISRHKRLARRAYFSYGDVREKYIASV